jgi:nitroreductase
MNAEDLQVVIECAELAPSVHNTQPWLFVANDEVIEVRADRDRGLPVLDPTGRELVISCGAAIELANVAVRGLGSACDVQLEPDPSDADLLATIAIAGDEPASAADLALFEAIPRRYTDRGSYEAGELTDVLLHQLGAGVEARGAWLRVLDHEGDRLAVIQALASAEESEAADPAYRNELTDWLRTGPAADGLPPAALTTPAPGSVTDVPLRDFTGGNRHPQPGGEGPPPSVSRDVLLLIGTEHDDRMSWLKAGRALGWLMLRLTVEGLASQPLGQVLDIDPVRNRLGRALGLLSHVQFLLRTGLGHGQPSTGRRHDVPAE